jgi:hypothetical protein
LIGLHGTERQRFEYLHKRKGMNEDKAIALIERDRSELHPLGQQTRDAFKVGADWLFHAERNAATCGHLRSVAVTADRGPRFRIPRGHALTFALHLWGVGRAACRAETSDSETGWSCLIIGPAAADRP